MRWCLGCEESGQMTVELAVMAPVVIVVSLIVYNLLTFVELCAQFDRVSHAAIVTQAVSPAGLDYGANASAAVRASIENAMPQENCEIDVVLTPESRLGEQAVFVTGPALVRVSCTLRYRPWPSAFSVAGADFSPPLFLVHERSLVIDRFRNGVVG